MYREEETSKRRNEDIRRGSSKERENNGKSSKKSLTVIFVREYEEVKITENSPPLLFYVAFHSVQVAVVVVQFQVSITGSRSRKLVENFSNEIDCEIKLHNLTSYHIA